MPRTTRLSEDATTALKEVAAAEGISENAVIENAVLEYAQKRVALRDAFINEIVSEYQPLLDRLA